MTGETTQDFTGQEGGGGLHQVALAAGKANRRAGSRREVILTYITGRAVHCAVCNDCTIMHK